MNETVKENRSIIREVINNNEDFEFYPTSERMVQAIGYHMEHSLYKLGYSYRSTKIESILDIGCGTCNFRKYLKRETNKYYGIEKSRTLINSLDDDVVLLGTDFNQATLIDKKVDVIFCNPPYTDFTNWMQRIILESNCKFIYLIVPTRWKENKDTLSILEKTGSSYTIIDTDTFLDGERKARATVDIVFINKINSNTDYAFNTWFDATFKIEETKKESEEERKERLNTEIAQSQNKIEVLVNNYNEDRVKLLNIFEKLATMDEEVLNEVGINKSSVKYALKTKIKGLKILYWELAFSHLEQINEVLTSESRKTLLNKFKEVMQVDFTYDNIYATVIWVIKNAYKYKNKQIVNFFRSISESEGIKLYKSNEKLFKKEDWRFNKYDVFEKDEYKYVLDYRIVCGKSVFCETSWYGNEYYLDASLKKLNDIKVICKTLGFEPTRIEVAQNYGLKGEVFFMNDSGKEELLFDYRFYKKGTCHVRFNQEFSKALNVTVSRLLGWVKTKEDIDREFPEDMARGAEKYFHLSNDLYTMIGNNTKLLGCSL